MNTKAKLVSVIVPVYNVREYVGECLDSILAEKADWLEVVVVDDGSSDGSSEICDRYAAADGRIVVEHQPNAGVSAARNRGMALASGKWIWFVDADDRIAAGALENIARELATGQCDTLIQGLETYGSNPGDSGRVVNARSEDAESKESILDRLVCYQNGMIIFSSDIIRKSSLQFLPGVKMGEDLDFQTRYFIRCRTPKVIEQVHYLWRQRRGSAMRQQKVSDLNNIEGGCRIVPELLKDIAASSNPVHPWLGKRLDSFMKGILVSYSRLDRPERKAYTKQVRRCLRDFRSSCRQLGCAAGDAYLYKLATISLRATVWQFRAFWRLKRIPLN